MVMVFFRILFLAWAISAAAEEGRAVKIRVTDSFTHLPVTGAEVFLADEPTEKAFRKLGTTTGRFYTLELTNAAAVYQFEVRAEGYDSFRSGRFGWKDAAPFYEAALARLMDFEGFVVAPTGQLTAGAHYFLCTDLTQVTFRPDRTFFTRSRAPDVTGASGRAHLSPESTGHGIVVSHDLGYAFAPLAGWTNGTRIRLEPWARVAGRMLMNGVPASNQMVSLQPAEGVLGKTRMAFLNFEGRTDTNGFFAFENVPPVGVYVSWTIPGDLAPVSVQSFFVDARTASNVTLNFRGREIFGAFQFSGHDGNWKPRIVSARLTRATELTEASIEFNGEKRNGNPEGAENYAVGVETDLTFESGLIPAGRYLATVAGYDGATATFLARGMLVVPEGAGRVNVGTITLTNAGSMMK